MMAQRNQHIFGGRMMLESRPRVMPESRSPSRNECCGVNERVEPPVLLVTSEEPLLMACWEPRCIHSKGVSPRRCGSVVRMPAVQGAFLASLAFYRAPMIRGAPL